MNFGLCVVEKDLRKFLTTASSGRVFKQIRKLVIGDQPTNYP